MIDRHRLFGLILMDFFTGSPFVVEVEKDLSEQQQNLDVIIIRRQPGEFHEPLPDGFGELVNHNLVTFKSHQEALSAWAVQELISHYVSYRKLVSPSTDVLLPESEFRLIAFCARSPQQLAGQFPLQKVGEGVYDYRCAGLVIHIVVAHELPLATRNALCHLFSALTPQVEYAIGHYEQHSPRTSSLLRQLFERYREEGLSMSYTMEDFEREVKEEMLAKMTLKERLEGLSPEQRMQGLPPEQRMQGLPPEVIEQYLKSLKSESPPKTEENGAENEDA